jgi:outer membrane receptor for ferrienterochelin and colicins
MYLVKRIFCPMILAISSNLSLAQKPKDSLSWKLIDPVVISATRSQRQASGLPLPLTVISNESIQKGGFSRLNEVLAEQTGLVLVPTFGGAEGLQMQGLDGAYTLVMIDGQTLLGRSSGQLDLGRLAVGNIERIEIIKGASSCLYGSEALAGVVNIITKTPKNKALQGQINYKIGRFATHDANAQVAFADGRWAWQLFANTFATQGYQLKPESALPTVMPYLNHSFQPKVTYTFSDDLKWQLSPYFFQQYQDHAAVIAGQRHRGQASINEMNLQSQIKQNISPNWALDYQFYLSSYGHQQMLNKPNGERLEDNFYQQYLYRPEVKALWKVNLAGDELSLGLGLSHETLNRSFFDEKQQLNGQYFFAQYDFKAIKKLNVLAGFRYDRQAQFDHQFSPKIAIAYEFLKHLKLKTSLGYGYKAPDFRQLYFDFTNASVGYTVLGRYVAQEKLLQMQERNQIAQLNKNIDFSEKLKPESSINANFGLQYRRETWQIEANAFYNNIYNLIETQAVAKKTNGQNVFSYLNLNKIYTYGLELNGQYQAHPKLKLSFGYQYLEAKNEQHLAEIAQGKVFAKNENNETFRLKKAHYVGLYNRSKHQINLKIDAQLPYLDTWLNLRAIYRSRFGMADSNGNALLDVYDEFVPAYTLLHLSLTQDFAQAYQLQVGCQNLLNVQPIDTLNLPGQQYYARIIYQF